MLFIFFLIYVTSTNGLLFLTSDNLNTIKEFKLCHYINGECINPVTMPFPKYAAFRSFYMDPRTNYYVLTVREQYNATINVYNTANKIVYSQSHRDPIASVVMTTQNNLTLYGFTNNLERLTDGKILYEFVHCFPWNAYDFYEDTYYANVVCLNQKPKNGIYSININTGAVYRFLLNYQILSINYNPIHKLLYIVSEDPKSSSLRIATFNPNTGKVHQLTLINNLAVISCGWNSSYTQLLCCMCEYICNETGPSILLTYNILSNTSSYQDVPYYIWKIIS